MEQQQQPEQLQPGGEPIIVYPPKFEKYEEKGNVWFKSILSLALYLALGIYIFKTWEILLLITAIVVIHELGHFFAMKYYRYNDLGIFFIPLLGAYVSGTKREVSQKESAVILLAGPLPGIIIGIVFHLFYQYDPLLNIADVSFSILFSTATNFLSVCNLSNIITGKMSRGQSFQSDFQATQHMRAAESMTNNFPTQLSSSRNTRLSNCPPSSG